MGLIGTNTGVDNIQGRVGRILLWGEGTRIGDRWSAEDEQYCIRQLMAKRGEGSLANLIFTRVR